MINRVVLLEHVPCNRAVCYMYVVCFVVYKYFTNHDKQKMVLPGRIRVLTVRLCVYLYFADLVKLELASFADCCVCGMQCYV